MDFSASDAFEHFDIDDFAAPSSMPPKPTPTSSSNVYNTHQSSTLNNNDMYHAHSTTTTTTSSKAAAAATGSVYADEHDDDYSNMYADDNFSDGRGGAGGEAEEEEDFGAFMGRIATLRQDAEVRKTQLATKKQLVATLQAKKAALEVEVAGVRGSIEADNIEKRFGQLRVQNGWEEALRRAQVALTALQSTTTAAAATTPTDSDLSGVHLTPSSASPYSTLTLYTLLHRYFPTLLYSFDSCIGDVVLPALHAHDEFTDSVVGGMERARLRRIALERHALLRSSSAEGVGAAPRPQPQSNHPPLPPPTTTLLSFLLTALVSQTPTTMSTTTSNYDVFKSLTYSTTHTNTTTTPSSQQYHPSTKQSASWCLHSDRLFIGDAALTGNNTTSTAIIHPPLTTTTTTTHTNPSTVHPTWDTVLGAHQSLASSFNNNNNNTSLHCETDLGRDGWDQQHHKRTAIVSFLEALLGLTNTVPSK